MLNQWNWDLSNFGPKVIALFDTLYAYSIHMSRGSQACRVSLTRQADCYVLSGISLGMRPANERRRYNITMSLIDWAHT